MRHAILVCAALASACASPPAAPRSPSAPASAPSANRDRHGPPDVASYIAGLEDSKRESYLPSARVAELLHLRGDEHVADLGCGPGVVTSALSRALPRGVVYAIDVEPAQLDRLNERITKEGLRNVMPVLCVNDDARLPDASVDAVLIVDTFHHFDDRVEYLRRLARALKPGGVIANVDFKDGDLPVGPPASHKVPRATMLGEFEAAGFRIEREDRGLQYHDAVVFSRAP